MSMIQRILVPTDFSSCAGFAADWAAHLARQLDCAVDAVTVVDTSPLHEAYGDEPYRNERIAQIRGEAARQLDAFVRRHFDGVEGVRPRVLDGDAAGEILRAAAEGRCGMIVMGTHGRGGLARLLVGSVAEKVVRESSVPVVTVRAPKRPPNG